MNKDLTTRVSIVIIAILLLASFIFIYLIQTDPSRNDTDGDGVTNDIDMYPDDPYEQNDSDGDGIGDNSDKFPLDPAASIDSDDDGYPDKWNDGKSQSDSTSNPQLEIDDLPYNPFEQKDSDGDGYGDNSDDFPNNPLEWEDKDLDGIGNNTDINDYVNLSFTLNLEKFKLKRFVDILPWGQIYFIIKINEVEFTELNNSNNYYTVWLNQEENIDSSIEFDIDDSTYDDYTNIEIIMYDHDYIIQDSIVDIDSQQTSETLNLRINHKTNSVNYNNVTEGNKAKLWYKLILAEEVNTSNDEIYTINYKFSYYGKSHEFTLEIPYKWYNLYYYKNDSRSPQIYSRNAMKKFVTINDEVIITLTEKLTELANSESLNDLETVNFVLNFVQQEIDYEFDNVTKGEEEYWRYPVETLVDRKGDCEDSTVLLASIMENMNYESVLLFYKIDNDTGHLALGVKINMDLDIDFVEYNGDKYYYCESTTTGYEVGKRPNNIPDEPKMIIPL
jgi:hypothetical protein